MEKLAANAAAARAEPGCLTFDVLVHPEDPDRIMLYEVYRSEEAFKEHQTTPAFKSYLAEAVPLLASRDRTFVTRVCARRRGPATSKRSRTVARPSSSNFCLR